MLLNSHDLLMAIKKASTEAVETTKPADFCFGKVISTSPLKISVEQKIILGVAQLVLTERVTDYTVTVGIEWETDYQSSGKKQITIYNGLKTGDKVVLMKQKGGQKYLVLDRVVNIS